MAQLFSLGSIRTTNKTHTTMKKQTISLLLAYAVALVFTGCATEHRSSERDYKVIYGSYKAPLEPQIQKAAADGWKVVSSGGGDSSPFVIMTKPK